MCRYCELEKSDIDEITEKGAYICATGECPYDYVAIVQKNDKQFYIQLHEYDDDDYSEPISFCPFCGKKLKTE